MKAPKNNIIENWQALRVRWQVKIKDFFVNVRYKRSIKSPCCNVPMGDKKVFPTVSQEPIYNCTKCNKKWL